MFVVGVTADQFHQVPILGVVVDFLPAEGAGGYFQLISVSFLLSVHEQADFAQVMSAGEQNHRLVGWDHELEAHTASVTLELVLYILGNRVLSIGFLQFLD